MQNEYELYNYSSLPNENLTFFYSGTTEKYDLYKYPLGRPSDWGPKRDPLYIVIPITIVYAVIFLTGVMGNVSTCIVIAKNRSMHTATNYYLFSLAISDLLLLVSALPNEMYLTWSKYPYNLGEEFCILHGFAAETSANATVLTITAFTVERYVAICHPFLSHTLSKLSRAIKFIIAVWIFAMCLAIPQALSFGIFYERDDNGMMTNDDHYICTVKRLIIPHAFEISTVLFFVAPMCLITVLYVLIGLQLHKSTVGPSRGNSVKMRHRVYKPVSVSYDKSNKDLEGATANQSASKHDEDGRKNFSRNAQATKHVVKMLVAVVVAFFICWAPFHAQRLLAMYGQHTSTHMVTAFRVLTYISGILYYLSTTVNPLLYHIMSNKFREAFKDTFRRCVARKERSPTNKCYTTLSAKSSQFNSHSNTDSCSRQSSLRYLDLEMARLHESRRPVIVSFKRKKAQPLKSQKRVAIFDAELQEALDNLIEEPNRKNIFKERSPGLKTGHGHHITIFDTSEPCPNECSYIELHSLQPRHICPVNGSLINTSKFCDDKIDEGQLRGRANSLKHEYVTISGTKIAKSRTMPHMIVDIHVN